MIPVVQLTTLTENKRRVHLNITYLMQLSNYLRINLVR